MQEKAARKKSVNLSIDAKLAAEAKDAGTNLSAVLEKALREKLREQHWQKWLKDNEKAIDASNDELKRNGMWYTPDWNAK